MRVRPKVALAIMDPKTPYRYLQIRGRVVEISEIGARDHINTLSTKYTGNPVFAVKPEEIRVIYKIQIENISTME
jgi:hypothetical protein